MKKLYTKVSKAFYNKEYINIFDKKIVKIVEKACEQIKIQEIIGTRFYQDIIKLKILCENCDIDIPEELVIAKNNSNFHAEVALSTNFMVNEETYQEKYEYIGRHS